MQKSKGLYLLKGVLVIGLVLTITGWNPVVHEARGRSVPTLCVLRQRITFAQILCRNSISGARSGAEGAMALRHAEATAGPALDWLNLEEAAGKLQKEQRPILIDLYTTWCGWCKQMDKKTYSNKQVAAYLREKFYPVKLDAETHAVISWKGREYRFNTGYRSNEFALYLTHGRLEFPTTIIIPPGGEPQAIPGYMEPKELELLVKYFGEGKYNQLSFDDWQKSFRSSW